MNDMPLKEVAGTLEEMESWRYLQADTHAMHVLRQAASMVRKVDAGELAEVIHAEWITVQDDVKIGDGTHIECSNCHTWGRIKSRYCPTCGCRMDGKDGSDEQAD